MPTGTLTRIPHLLLLCVAKVTRAVCQGLWDDARAPGFVLMGWGWPSVEGQMSWLNGLEEQGLWAATRSRAPKAQSPVSL